MKQVVKCKILTHVKQQARIEIQQNLSFVGSRQVHQGAGIRVFTQMTRRQNFDGRPGTGWTHVKFDTRMSQL